MDNADPGRLRAATEQDAPRLLMMWAALFDDEPGIWRTRAQEWFLHALQEQAIARLPVVEVDGEVVSTAVGTLELGVPNPHCPRGRAVRLANVVTDPEHRGRGHGTRVVDDVIAWARTVDADRVDLSSTPDGRRLYERTGFVLTSAPRMKLVL